MLDDLVEDCDLVLVMSVNPGMGGQAFIPRAIEKLKEARELVGRRNPACEIEVDGGVGDSNLRDVIDAGASVVVMGSAIFGHRDPAGRLRHMRSFL
jgi:ribulose-phosphate 3-epimerase